MMTDTDFEDSRLEEMKLWLMHYGLTCDELNIKYTDNIFTMDSPIIRLNA